MEEKFIIRKIAVQAGHHYSKEKENHMDQGSEQSLKQYQSRSQTQKQIFALPCVQEMRRIRDGSISEPI